MMKNKNIMLFEEFNSLNEKHLKLNPTAQNSLSDFENLCKLNNINCNIASYNFETETFKYKNKTFKINSSEELFEFFKNIDFLFYPELNIFADIKYSDKDIPKWILIKEFVKIKGTNINYFKEYAA